MLSGTFLMGYDRMTNCCMSGDGMAVGQATGEEQTKHRLTLLGRARGIEEEIRSDLLT
jgi:hypothetical protein